jgi:TIR domain
MKIFVVESADVWPEIADAVREGLSALDHQVGYSTDGGGNRYLRVLDADLVLAVASNWKPTEFMLFGWTVRGTPILVVASLDDPAAGILFQRESNKEISYSPGDRPAFLEALAERIRAVEANPVDFMSKHVRGELETTDTGTTRPKESVFISYSHRDAQFLERLMVHLKPLSVQNRVALWSDRQIRPGDAWRDEIARALESAGIAVLLVSPDFLASDFIVTNELPTILSGAKKNGTRVLPVVVRPCRFTRDPELQEFQAFREARPVAGMSDVEQDAVWDEVAQEIEERVNPPD